MNKNEIIARLDELGVAFNNRDTKYILAKLLYRLELLLALQDKDIKRAERFKIELREVEVEHYVGK